MVFLTGQFHVFPFNTMVFEIKPCEHNVDLCSHGKQGGSDKTHRKTPRGFDESGMKAIEQFIRCAARLSTAKITEPRQSKRRRPFVAY